MKNRLKMENNSPKRINRSILKTSTPTSPNNTHAKTGPDPDAPSSSSAGPQRTPLGPPRAGRGRPSRRRRSQRPPLRSLPRRLGPRRHRRRRLRLRVCQQERHLRRASTLEPAVRPDPGAVCPDGPAVGGVAVLQGGDDCQRGGGEARQGWLAFFFLGVGRGWRGAASLVVSLSL